MQPNGTITDYPFPGYEVQNPTAVTPLIRRTTFLAGQTIAINVSGDPVSANNGLFFIYSDHLGSPSMLHKSGQSNPFTGSTTRYLPFGGYRGTPPSQAITDRDFTGQRENMEVGLLYYNARYYLPGIARFISADTLVPNPTNPQSFNRYSYVRNSPLNFTDPTGHCAAEGVGGEGQCTPIPSVPLPPREKRIGVPPVIQNATPFDTLPFDPSAYDGTEAQPFGDSQLAEEKRDYAYFGYLHPGMDIPMPEGTELLALGKGVVTCGGDTTIFCGQQPTSGGHGIGILYEACQCVVYYVHAENELVKGTQVSAGDVVAVSGVGNGSAHLHLEVRDTASPAMVYNPLYFFNEDTWNSIGLNYAPYHNGYESPETRMYAMQLEAGHNYWDGPSYPLVWVR